MDTRQPNQLSHEQALELLPWHVNASLDEDVGRQVASHVQECASCQQEVAFLANAVFAVNADEPEYGRVEDGLARVMKRIERAEAATPQSASGTAIGALLRRWFDVLDLLAPRYAGATLGVVALAFFAALIVADRAPSEVPSSDSTYRVLASSDAPQLQMMVHLKEDIDEQAMRAMVAELGVEFSVERLADRRYLLKLPGETEAMNVSRLLMGLKDDSRIRRIDIVTD